MKWQAIETAPKDGTIILGYENGEYSVSHWAVGKFETEWWQLSSGRAGDYVTPTHWMPLPEPPE